ncbi:MAG TPA: hypothetical protein DCE41_07560 [Cytophagales bacterium]|nr:hypothetical protein [Cytophagales bacterium]HAA18124.1 hypothetical protein [Cytophagales bacterium]HAP62089.1 hypothetical protein [Cytophagales bacterium]
MVVLLIAILFNVAIFAIFRVMPRLRAVTLHAIVVNYWVCVVTGGIFSASNATWSQVSFRAPWAPWALVLAVIFITTFLLMANTTQRLSMTVASVASKMSLAIPVLFSLLVLGVQAKEYDVWNYLGIVLAFPAIVLSSWAKSSGERVPATSRWKGLALPIGLFLMSGLLDATVNYVNLNFISEEFSPVFTVILYMCAGTLGIGVLLVRRELPSRRSFLAGIILGVPNYFSIYIVFRALSTFNNDGALLFPLLNLGIILGSAVAGTLIFREKQNKIKIIGLGLAMLAIFLLSYQELLGY